LEFRILGSGSAAASIQKSHSCLWLEDEQLLIDCGEGATQKLMRFDLLDSLKSVVISHFHPDHVTGIFTLLQTMHIHKRRDSLNIYLPESIAQFKETLKMFYIDISKFSFECCFLQVEEIVHEFGVIPIPTSHLRRYNNLKNACKSYSFYFPETGFVFSSDVNSLEFLKQVDNKGVIVLDGLHPDADEILLLGSETKSRIILTHGLSLKLEKKISTTNRFEIADENKKYNFQRNPSDSGGMQ